MNRLGIRLARLGMGSNSPLGPHDPVHYLVRMRANVNMKDVGLVSQLRYICAYSLVSSG